MTEKRGRRARRVGHRNENVGGASHRNCHRRPLRQTNDGQQNRSYTGDVSSSRVALEVPADKDRLPGKIQIKRFQAMTYVIGWLDFPLLPQNGTHT